MFVVRLPMCGCVNVCEFFLPGNELSAMTKSFVRLLSPLKLHLFYHLLRRQVAFRIWQVAHHESEDGYKIGKKKKI